MAAHGMRRCRFSTAYAKVMSWMEQPRLKSTARKGKGRCLCLICCLIFADGELGLRWLDWRGWEKEQMHRRRHSQGMAAGNGNGRANGRGSVCAEAVERLQKAMEMAPALNQSKGQPGAATFMTGRKEGERPNKHWERRCRFSTAYAKVMSWSSRGGMAAGNGNGRANRRGGVCAEAVERLQKALDEIAAEAVERLDDWTMPPTGRKWVNVAAGDELEQLHQRQGDEREQLWRDSRDSWKIATTGGALIYGGKVVALALDMKCHARAARGLCRANDEGSV
eukprot:s5756_g1.t1